MDAIFMEQHFLRSPLRLCAEMDTENNNSLYSAAMMEKARAHLQMWGRTGGPPYSPAELHTLLMNGAGPGAGPPPMYALGSPSRGGPPPPCQIPMPLPAHLWAGGAGGGHPPSPWSTQASVHASLPPGLLGPPPLPPPNAHSHPQLTPPPPATSSSSSSGSPSPSSPSPAELRLPRPIFPGMSGLQQRYSPYHLVPKQLSPPVTPDIRN
jgi:T-box protein 20